MMLKSIEEPVKFQCYEMSINIMKGSVCYNLYLNDTEIAVLLLCSSLHLT